MEASSECLRKVLVRAEADLASKKRRELEVVKAKEELAKIEKKAGEIYKAFMDFA